MSAEDGEKEWLQCSAVSTVTGVRCHLEEGHQSHWHDFRRSPDDPEHEVTQEYRTYRRKT